jgi:hypothetical protein
MTLLVGMGLHRLERERERERLVLKGTQGEVLHSKPRYVVHI